GGGGLGVDAELADEIGGDGSYRRMTTYAGFAAARADRRSAPGSFHLDWVADDVSLSQRLGGTQTTAQVHPGRFTQALMEAAKPNTELRIGEVTGVVREGARVAGIEVDGGIIAGDAVVIAMGPWSILAARWLPLPAVFGLKGHSLVFDTGTQVPAEALFLDYREDTGAAHAPEIFPRADGTTYVCAISSESPVPLDPAAVGPDPGASERLEAMCA